MNSVIDQFDVLCRKADEAYSEELDVSYESTLLDILEFVKQHPESKFEFVNKFIEMLSTSKGPIEVVAFCMRELKWPEIKEFVVQQMNSSKDPRSEALRATITAYDNHWPDSDLYEYYSK